MAYTITLRDEGPAASTSGQTATTDSFTPAANSRLFAFVYARNNGNITDHQFAISDTASLSWTEVAHPALAVSGGEFAARGIMYRANVGGSPSSMTVTFDANNTNADTFFYTWIVFDVTASAGESLGLRQVASNSEVEAEGASETITATFAAAAETGNLVVACFGADDSSGEGMSAPSGFTSLVVQTTHIHAAAFHRSDFTSTAITCPDLGTGPVTSAVIAFELGPIKVAIDTASLALGGQQPAVAGVTVSVAIDPAVLTLTGQDATVSFGAAPINVDAATLTLTGQQPALTGTGTTSTPINTAALPFAAQDVTAAPSGAAPIVVDPAALSLTGQTPTIAGTGTASVAVDAAVLAPSGQEIAASAGTVIAVVEPATLTLTGLTPVVAGATATVAVDTAALTMVGQDVAVVPGTADVAVDAAILVLVGADVTAIGTGLGNTALDPATLVLVGVQITIGVLPMGSPSVSRRWRVRADDRVLAPIHDRIIRVPANTGRTIGASP